MKLTWVELFVAATVGVLRRVGSVTAGERDRHGAKDCNAWTLNIEGAIGELAVSKGLNVYWPMRVNAHRQADIGDDIEVRMIMNRWKQYYLRLYKDDKDDRRYYLVTHGDQRNEYVIQGWMLGSEAKQEKYWGNPLKNDRPNAYFVPSGELHSL